MIDVFLIHDEEERRAAIRAAIASCQNLSLVNESPKGRDGMYNLAAIPPVRPRICVVRLALPDVNGLDLIPQLRLKNPDVYIVPILEGNETGQIWQKLLKLELQDCINGPVSNEEMAGVLMAAAPKAQNLYDTLKAQKHGSVTESFIISFMSARGGLGKTVLATNMAAALAKLSKQVTLMDFSLNPGDFLVTLDDVPRSSIMDAAGAGGGLDVELMHNLLGVHKLGFRYLASPSEEFDSKQFDYNVANSIIQVMRNTTAYGVIDTGLPYAVNSDPWWAAADNSDIIFLVTTRDVVRLLSTQRLLKVLKERDISSSKLKVIVNQAEIGVEISESEIESTLEHPVTAYIPSNPGPVTFSINRGEPIVAADPNDSLSHIITRLGQLCFNHWQDKPVPEAATQKGGIFKKKTVSL